MFPYNFLFPAISSRLISASAEYSTALFFYFGIRNTTYECSSLLSII
jgi:hypothetical protein